MKTITQAILVVLIACLCQGCLVLPIPTSGKHAIRGHRISKEGVVSIKAGQTPRVEVIARFGDPFSVCEEHSAIAYNWVVITWRWYLIIVTPYDAGVVRLNYMSDRSQVLMLQFDRDDRVMRYQFENLWDDQAVKDVLCKWAGTEPVND